MANKILWFNSLHAEVIYTLQVSIVRNNISKVHCGEYITSIVWLGYVSLKRTGQAQT